MPFRSTDPSELGPRFAQQEPPPPVRDFAELWKMKIRDDRRVARDLLKKRSSR